MTVAVTTSLSSMVGLGARNIVLLKFYDSALPFLTRQQCMAILARFQSGVEDAMALMDDQALPAEFHATVLKETNECIARLRMIIEG
ncbi:hypothetical protein H3V53_32230 [Paraburkholderia bengalensis]|uniref:Uncharacterized protein n=2 Tax=Paraburkholderia bengalensis TaxID=2747562 RepID=A0ABU8J1T2_9BURK